MGWIDWLTGSKNPSSRRQQVERDGVYYCSVCGKHKASKPLPGNDATCSDTCMKAMKASALLHGAFAFGTGAQRVPQRKTMCCKWCSSRISYPPSKSCTKCDGIQRA